VEANSETNRGKRRSAVQLDGEKNVRGD